MKKLAFLVIGIGAWSALLGESQGNHDFFYNPHRMLRA